MRKPPHPDAPHRESPHRRRGRTIFFFHDRGSLTSVAVDVGTTFKSGPPRQILDNKYAISTNGPWSYDIDCCRERFLMFKEVTLDDRPTTRPTLVAQHWRDTAAG